MSPQSRLERYEQRTEWPLVGVALTFLALYSVKVLAKPHDDADKTIEYALIAIFLVFIADYIVRLSLAQPRGPWFLKHLWELPILLLPFLRPLRLLSLAVVINSLQRAVGHTIRGRVIIYTACAAVAIVYAGSLAILDVEGNHPERHPQIDTLGGITILGSITATLASWIVQRVAEEDTANQAATTAHIDELREEIRGLTEALRAEGGGLTGERVEGNR